MDATGEEPFYESIPEAVRHVERTLDHQSAAMDLLHRKNEQSIALGVGALGGGLALVVLLAEKTSTPLDAALLSIMLAGASANLAALVILVFAGLATSTELHLGPDAAWLREKALDETWTELELRLALLMAAPGDIAFNREQMTRGARRRRAGLSLLVLAVALDGVACLYIVRRMML